MTQALGYLKETASQTAGPYVHIGLIPHMAGFDIFQNNFGNVLVGAQTKGEHIVIEGRVLDGTGTPVRDALLEIWQANAAGRYNHPADRQNKPLDDGFRGWGRTGAEFDTGLYRFETVKPGKVPGRDGRMMAPHINFWVVARGINIGLSTRMYFADEAEANTADPILNAIEQEVRRGTLVAQRSSRGGKTVYTFDIVLQGDNETVFFDI
ncbi:MAG: protocatechuate 3,4-dioxygenase subunit alpha [Pseudorhodoplanes sp.]|nr:Protocatechuate 3,4-dioxygenase alpha chain [Pseudorhodoplanes sp.]MBW7950932.1 protocatechuate 3,4-dioxygenase subunit alpha [Pseudorhodoplanes sp.]MCL4709913.1 protocatechuate 3,4-dioxygenase subunit alpha [Pseudorhodoplanes sp.]MCQ3942280.1 protocatechuate 3,4-dioxygenase subunit alpha [Alphaproteobacteria bacterium]MCZ7642079.1 protocatechuate 3,4-dioxygenase subunit alpha [Pseudorhodoplanes sp.]